MLALHHEAWTPFQQDPALAAAVDRQEQVRLGLGARAFPDTDEDQEDQTPTSLEEIRAQQRQANDATRIAAILRARAERAGRPVSPPPCGRPGERPCGPGLEPGGYFRQVPAGSCRPLGTPSRGREPD